MLISAINIAHILWHMSRGVNCSWSNTEIKDRYLHQITFTNNQRTDALALGVHYDCFCRFVLWTVKFRLSSVIYKHFKSTGHRNTFE